MPAQIAVLLALTTGLFDLVPIHQMGDAVRAVREAAAAIPPEVCARFDGTGDLTAEDCTRIIDSARLALGRFQPKSEATADAAPRSKSGDHPTPPSRTEGTPTPREGPTGPR